MKRVGIYARVSSGRQEKEHTIASQLAALEEQVTAAGDAIDPAHRYIDDGWSGETLLRPGLDALRDAVLMGGVDCVVIYDPDRLARRFVDQQVVLEEIARRQVDVVFIHGGVARTPEEQMALGVRGIFAEYERAKILDRTRRGRLHRARGGAPPAWANPPYGYRRLRGERHQPGTIVIEECEAAFVREIFAWVGLEGLCLRRVALRLEQRGIRPRTGKHWAPSTLGQMVRNRVYVGQAHHQKYETVEPEQPHDRLRYRRHRKSSRRRRPEHEWIGVRVPAIVDEALFNTTQQRLIENRRKTAGQVKHAYLLRGLLYCGVCERKMWGFGSDFGTQRERRYYACHGRDRHALGGEQQCPSRPVRGEDVERLVWEDLARWLQEPEQIATQLEAQRGTVRTVLDAYAAEQRRLAREKRALAESISRLVDAYQGGVIGLDELRGRRERLEETTQRCEAKLAELEQQHRHALAQRRVVDELEQLKLRLHKGLERCTWEDRRAIVELLIEKIEVAEPNLRVHYIVPLGTSAQRSHDPGATPISPVKMGRPGTAQAAGPGSGLYQPCPRGGERSR
jgi:site-specific DNA recombinase